MVKLRHRSSYFILELNVEYVWTNISTKMKNGKTFFACLKRDLRQSSSDVCSFPLWLQLSVKLQQVLSLIHLVWHILCTMAALIRRIISTAKAPAAIGPYRWGFILKSAHRPGADAAQSEWHVPTAEVGDKQRRPSPVGKAGNCWGPSEAGGPRGWTNFELQQ